MTSQEFMMLLAQLNRIATALEVIAKKTDPEFRTLDEARAGRRSEKPAQPEGD